MTYQAPSSEYDFIFQYSLHMQALYESDHFHQASPEIVQDILKTAAVFAEKVLFPAYQKSESLGVAFENNQVIMPDIMHKVYAEFCTQGYGMISAPTEYGGLGLPYTVFSSVFERIASAHMGFSLCPLLSQGVIHVLLEWGDDAQKKTYLPKLVSGQWAGTMNLTESQAGSDLGAIHTKATPQADGSYLLTGEKIYITYGDHDLTANIIHLVLARLPDAPEGTKGLSLFLVPKFLVHEDGSLGARNSVYAAGIEEKLGIHSSPTCSMVFKDAKAFLVGKEHHGIKAMFTMMNDARLQVGVQGVAVSEIACQKAIAYAKQRQQGGKLENGNQGKPTKEATAIIHHHDIQRHLCDMISHTQASRFLVMQTAYHLDKVTAGIDAEFSNEIVDFLIPIVKAWATDLGVKNSSQALQIFGGAGYIEETGIACHLRDARILPIYEGTNGIQAIDLVTRKLGRNEMKVFRHYAKKIAMLSSEILEHEDFYWQNMGDVLELAGDDFLQAGEWMYQKWWLLDQGAEALVGATPFLELCGLTLGGYFMIESTYRASQLVGADDKNLQKMKQICHFYCENILPKIKFLSTSCCKGLQTIGNPDIWWH